jgi:hypothetical protein
VDVNLDELKLEIYCQYGHWDSEDQQNFLLEFLKAVAYGFGVETDIRDSQSPKPISHDSVSNSSFSIEELPKSGTPIAINVKVDGLVENQVHGFVTPNDFDIFNNQVNLISFLKIVKNNLNLEEAEA